MRGLVSDSLVAKLSTDDYRHATGSLDSIRQCARSRTQAELTALTPLTRFKDFMSGIAVISAFNPYNYGMYSVDLAASQFFTALGVPFTSVVTQGRTRTGRLRFELRREPAFFEQFHTVVYWGDFLNNPMWGAGDYAWREFHRHGARDRAQGFANWRDLYLNLKRHQPQLRVVAAGGCFLGANGQALAEVCGDFAEFLGSAELVAPRDERSSQIVGELAPGASAMPGIDCAWLLSFPPRPPVIDSNYFVCFLGRTLRRDDRSFLRELAARSGLIPVWVDWLNLRRPRFIAHWNFERMHRLIAGARFVVTDAYHLAINALNRGVRTICLYDAEHSESDGTCADAKKRALLQQVGMSSLLVDVRETKSLAERIAALIDSVDQRAEAQAFEKIACRRDEFRRLLSRTLMPDKSNPS